MDSQCIEKGKFEQVVYCSISFSDGLTFFVKVLDELMNFSSILRFKELFTVGIWGHFSA